MFISGMHTPLQHHVKWYTSTFIHQHDGEIWWVQQIDAQKHGITLAQHITLISFHHPMQWSFCTYQYYIRMHFNSGCWQVYPKFKGKCLYNIGSPTTGPFWNQHQDSNTLYKLKYTSQPFSAKWPVKSGSCPNHRIYVPRACNWSFYAPWQFCNNLTCARMARNDWDTKGIKGFGSYTLYKIGAYYAAPIYPPQDWGLLYNHDRKVHSHAVIVTACQLKRG